jgi:hypothetical protein
VLDLGGNSFGGAIGGGDDDFFKVTVLPGRKITVIGTAGSASHSIGCTLALLNAPEAQRKLAGGVSHRITVANGVRPGRGGGNSGVARAIAPAGADSRAAFLRWLTPPANFRGASGTEQRVVCRLCRRFIYIADEGSQKMATALRGRGRIPLQSARRE